MVQEADTIHHSEASWKCLHCGLRNFLSTKRCLRCKSDPSLAIKGSKDDKQTRAESDGSGRFSSAWIFAPLVAVLMGLGFVYLRQSPSDLPAITVAAVEPARQEAEQPAKDDAEQKSESEAVATQVISELMHFQDATESGMDYHDYDKKLNGIKSDLNNALPSFVRHDPNDEVFRREVGAALRDYTAAGNWWKTTLTYSSVFTEADRNERTQRNWASARAHLTNAEKMLAH